MNIRIRSFPLNNTNPGIYYQNAKSSIKYSQAYYYARYIEGNLSLHRSKISYHYLPMLLAIATCPVHCTKSIGLHLYICQTKNVYKPYTLHFRTCQMVIAIQNDQRKEFCIGSCLLLIHTDTVGFVK